MIEQKIRGLIRDVKDFPKPGIIFRDITPVLQSPGLTKDIVDELAKKLEHLKIDVITGVESRGFLFGMLLAQRLNVPFVPIRKAGKLPYHKISYVYNLEYGSATVEMHRDSISAGQHVLIHDDLLATGGTMVAASEMVRELGGKISGYAFLISLDFLNGRKSIEKYSSEIISLVNY
jgi:adenine phosphoribosyltransferase